MNMTLENIIFWRIICVLFALYKSLFRHSTIKTEVCARTHCTKSDNQSLASMVRVLSCGGNAILCDSSCVYVCAHAS